MGFKKNTEPCKVKEKECPDLSNCELQDIGNVDTGNLQDGDVLCFLNGEWTNVPKNLSKVAYKETLDSDPDDGFKEIVLYYVDDNGPVIGSEFSFTVPDSTEIPDDVVTYVFNPLPNGGVSAEAFDVSGVSLGVQTLGSDDQTASEVPALDEDGQETTVQACLDDVKKRVSALEAKPDNSVASATIANDVITITEDNGDTHTVTITHPPVPDEEGIYLDGVNTPVLDVAAKTLTYSTVIDEGEAAGTPIVLDLTPMFAALTSPAMPTFTGNAISFNAATNEYTITDTDTTIPDTFGTLDANADGSFAWTPAGGGAVVIIPAPETLAFASSPQDTFDPTCIQAGLTDECGKDLPKGTRVMRYFDPVYETEGPVLATTDAGYAGGVDGVLIASYTNPTDCPQVVEYQLQASESQLNFGTNGSAGVTVQHSINGGSFTTGSLNGVGVEPWILGAISGTLRLEIASSQQSNTFTVQPGATLEVRARGLEAISGRVGNNLAYCIFIGLIRRVL